MSSHLSQNISIKDIELNARENGLTLKLYATDEIQLSEISGRFNEATSWSYLTFYNMRGDINKINQVSRPKGISGFEAIQLNQSLQIGLRSINQISQFEFYHDKNDSTVIASLRYPISTTMAYIEKREITSKEKNKTFFSSLINVNTPYYLISIILAGLLILQI